MKDQQARSRFWVVGLSVGVAIYSVLVLWVVAMSGDIGLRCVFGTKVNAEVHPSYSWEPTRPEPGATPTKIGPIPIGEDNYTDVIQAQQYVSIQPIGTKLPVEWRDADGQIQRAEATVDQRPLSSWIWSLIWVLQEMIIFGIGAMVLWNRPRDDSARIFFWLCVATVGAFIGGFHWSEIVIVQPLIFLFALFALFVPILSLHFYLVFPRPNPVLLLHRRAVLATLYGIPLVYLGALWVCMAWMSIMHRSGGATAGTALGSIGLPQLLVKWLALGYVGFSVLIFGLCIVCLVSSYRRARNRIERNQVAWILMASLISSFFIAYLLWKAAQDTALLGLYSAAWPMYVVSLLYTLAYANSITRYKLARIEEVFNQSVRYVLFSLAFSLLYTGVLVAGAFLIGMQMQRGQTSLQALGVGITALVFLVLWGLTQQRFQSVIDRRFHRDKYKFDQAMQKMSQAVDRLVDRSTIGQRVLEAAGEVLRLEWGTIYIRESAGKPLGLVASIGPDPEERWLEPENPLVDRLRTVPTIWVTRLMTQTSSDPATDAMISLGGEVAIALRPDQDLVGLMVLGPKRSGLPYEEEEVAFLRALSSVATLALHSSGIQQTLESLNRELRDKVEKIAEQQRRIMVLQDQLSPQADGSKTDAESASVESEPEAFARIKGSSPAMRRMINVARKVSLSPSAVLVLGESGTGKELLAEAIHAASPRASGPFVKVHCAALSQSLLESELFGHVKGAFTGADRDRVGRFQQADGGTLFLDEIGDINLEVQTKLLRVLQGFAFERVGSSQPINVDVRIIAATHQDLIALIAAGRFRDDLYYRLNVISIRTPALRERKDDIFELAVHFLRSFAERMGKPITHLDDTAVEALVTYDWPGNIRELENVIERAVVLADGPAITRDDLPPELFQHGRRRARSGAALTLGRQARRRLNASTPSETSASNGDTKTLDDQELQAYERHRLLDALTEAQNNKSEAARLLGMPRSTLVSKLKKLGLLGELPPREARKGNQD